MAPARREDVAESKDLDRQALTIVLGNVELRSVRVPGFHLEIEFEAALGIEAQHIAPEDS